MKEKEMIAAEGEIKGYIKKKKISIKFLYTDLFVPLLYTKHYK